MSIKNRSKPELQDLLAQLARFFRANETRISAEQVSKCLEHLPAIEISALDRLFFLLYQNETPQSESVSARGSISRPGWTLQDGPFPRSSGDRLGHTGHENPPSPASLPSSCGNAAAPTQGGFDNHATTCSAFGEDTTLFEQSSQNISTALPATGLVALHQAETITLHAGSDDDTFSKTSLATCSEIKFAPSTERLLEDCRANRGDFLRAIREAKAAFPTGQGWEAAIATKKENADIRDLMKIYHRFECHNIYKHVVEAGFHTGTHWIRDMRTVLANKLYQGFPERFQNQKTANKSLNWVDQGCRYHKWAEMFSETPDLGYLIALPSDLSHSAYTSRCTKEQMDAAALKFKSLGIDDLVKNLELSELGNHIAATLREMTDKKRKNVQEETIQSSRKSPRLTLNPSIQPLALQSDENTTPPESMATDHHLFRHSTESLMPNLAQEQPGNHGRQDQNTNGSVVDDCVDPYDHFNNLELSSPAYSQLFLSQHSAFSTPSNEWYQHPTYTEECVAN